MVWPHAERNVKGARVGDYRGAEVTVPSESRAPAVVREELADLLSYLNGLPDETRRGGAFLAYEERVGELSRELVLTDMQMAFGIPGEATAGSEPGNEYGRMRDHLSESSRRYEVTVRLHLWWSRSFLLLAGLAGFVLAGLAGFAILAPGLSTAGKWMAGYTVAVAVFGLLYVEVVIRRYQKAMRLAMLREVMSRSFGPGGEVLRPSEYYSATAKRVESLLDEIKSKR